EIRARRGLPNILLRGGTGGSFSRGGRGHDPDVRSRECLSTRPHNFATSPGQGTGRFPLRIGFQTADSLTRVPPRVARSEIPPAHMPLRPELENSTESVDPAW